MNRATVASCFGNGRRYSSSSTRLNASSSFHLASRLDNLDRPTVWHEFSPLAAEHQSINLGQGFPDWDPPQFAIDSMIQAIDNPTYHRNANQYARSAAHLPLAVQLAADYEGKLERESIDPLTEVATALGCTNALYCALNGIIDEGDEVILLEPAFDIYGAQVKMAGGNVKFVPLRPATATATEPSSDRPTVNSMFTLDMNELEQAITPKTKLFILNTPHNPTGKMFTKSEMESIADIMERNPHVTIITDEVYEHIIFDPVNYPHISFASLPGMYDRTITLSSSGKTFSATGWKIGWAIGPPHLIRAVSSVQQWVSFCVPTPNQDAIALCLAKAKEPYQGHDSYYQYLAAEYLRKRDLLMSAMECAGITPIVPNGGFFIMGDTSHISFPSSYLDEITPAMPCTPMPRDWAMSRWMTKEVGVTTIPPSAFYDKETLHLAKDMQRFAFCKGDDTILEAKAKFEDYFGKESESK